MPSARAIPIAAEILAQPRQRTVMQEAGEIVRSVGQQLAAAETDEQIEVFAFHAFGGSLAGGLRERGVGEARRCRIGAQLGQFGQQLRIRCAREQRGDQRIFLRACSIHFIDVAGHLVSAVKIGAQDGAIDSGNGFDRDHAFRRNANPIGNGRLGNADLARKLADAAGGAYRFGKSWFPHP